MPSMPIGGMQVHQEVSFSAVQANAAIVSSVIIVSRRRRAFRTRPRAAGSGTG